MLEWKKTITIILIILNILTTKGRVSNSPFNFLYQIISILFVYTKQTYYICAMKKENKVGIYIRLDKDIVDWLRTIIGYNALINKLLKREKNKQNRVNNEKEK